MSEPPPRQAPRRSPVVLEYINSQMSLGARLLCLCLVFGFPILLLTWLFVVQSLKEISFAQREVDGAKYEAKIWPVLRSSAFDFNARSNIADLTLARGRYDAEFDTQSASQALIDAKSPSQALRSGKLLMDMVADRSNLTLDTDLDSFYVMDAVTVRLPTLLVALDALEQAADAANDRARAVRIAESLQTLRGAADAASDDFVTAIRDNRSGATRTALAAHVAALSRLADAVTAHRDALIADAPAASLAPDVRALRGELFDTWRVARDEMQRLLEARIGRLTQSLALNLGFVVYFVGLAAALALIFTHGIRGRVSGLLASMDRLIAGETSLQVPFQADQNESGRIARTVEAFRLSLIEAARLRDEADESRAVAEAERERVVRFLSVGELASSIAHEINQPIAAVMAGGAAALRWLEHSPPNIERAHQAISRILRDTDRASAVIRRMRQILGKNAPMLSEVDINLASEEALHFTERERALGDVSLELDLAPSLPTVKGDQVQLQQVIINLALNGVDAMKSVTDRPRILRLTTALSEEGFVEVSMTDSGSGFQPGAAEKLFDAFYTTKPTGMGLGLSISRSIIDYHGGRIWAEDAPAGGAMFHFTLPVWPARKGAELLN
jgi:C4-dicarboxylate-specific signal transduction histidine kinase